MFIIYKVNPTLPVTYKIKKILDNGKYRYIQGDFYEQELQKTQIKKDLKKILYMLL